MIVSSIGVDPRLADGRETGAGHVAGVRVAVDGPVEQTDGVPRRGSESAVDDQRVAAGRGKLQRIEPVLNANPIQ